MTNTFDPSVWIAQGQRVSAAGDAMYASAHDMIVLPAIDVHSGSPLDDAVRDADAKHVNAWHETVAAAYEYLDVIGATMIGTGQDYAATEADAEAAGKRFWGGVL